jgi:hypothetical protein
MNPCTFLNEKLKTLYNKLRVDYIPYEYNDSVLIVYFKTEDSHEASFHLEKFEELLGFVKEANPSVLYPPPVTRSFKYANYKDFVFKYITTEE